LLFLTFQCYVQQYAHLCENNSKICTEGKLADSTVEGIVRQNGYSESTMCSGGSLEIPTVPAALVGSLPCSSSFAADANDCLKTFHQKFAADKADPSLCT